MSSWRDTYASLWSQPVTIFWTFGSNIASPSAGADRETSYGVNQNIWMPGSLSLHPQTILPWLLPSLLLDSSQLCEEHFLEQSFLSACHWICFLFHLPDLIPTEDTILMVKKRTAATAHWVKYLEALWSLGCSITSMFKSKPKPPPSCRACALKQ